MTPEQQSGYRSALALTKAVSVGDTAGLTVLVRYATNTEMSHLLVSLAALVAVALNGQPDADVAGAVDEAFRALDGQVEP